MFLAGEAANVREQYITNMLDNAPSVALIVAAVHFEWTVFRAVVHLSGTPNAELRTRVERVYGLDHYKDFWSREVSRIKGQTLPTIVRNWDAVVLAFKARGSLVHGRDRYTRNMARPHVVALLGAAADIRTFCADMGIKFDERLPVRKKTHRSRLDSPNTPPT